VITVVLRGGLTPAERTLRHTGHAETVSEQRSIMHAGLRDEFVREISRITGRDVIAFMSGIQQDPDMAAGVFVLASGTDEPGSAADSPETHRSPGRKTDFAATRARAQEANAVLLASNESMRFWSGRM
jgi:Na+-translocating membrane potential-generating system (MpsC)